MNAYLTYTSVVPYFLISVILLFLVRAYVKNSNFISNELNVYAKTRESLLDGLRGFLALGVFFTHSVIMYHYYVNGGQWQGPPSLFYGHLGSVAVSLFFMITGYLFWKKIIETQKLQWKKFFISRIKRIVPLYGFTVLVVVAIVFIVTGFHLNVTVPEIVISVIRWFSFGILGAPDINALKHTFTIESVYWTLGYEWKFYFLLPLISLLSHRPKMTVALLLAGCAGLMNIHFLHFVIGIIVATYIVESRIFMERMKFLHMAITVSFIGMLFYLPHEYKLLQAIISGLFFWSVLLGNNLLGLLSTTSAKVLGIVSYSIYLNHNIVLFILFSFVDRYVKSIMEFSAVEFWELILCSGICTVLFSLWTYKYIEHRFYVPSAIRKNKQYGSQI